MCLEESGQLRHHRIKSRVARVGRVRGGTQPAEYAGQIEFLNVAECGQFPDAMAKKPTDLVRANLAMIHAAIVGRMAAQQLLISAQKSACNFPLIPNQRYQFRRTQNPVEFSARGGRIEPMKRLPSRNQIYARIFERQYALPARPCRRIPDTALETERPPHASPYSAQSRSRDTRNRGTASRAIRFPSRYQPRWSSI